MLAEDAFFEFANIQSYTWYSIETGKDIEISEEVYADFRNWLSDKTIDYSSDLEKELKAFKILADQSGELEGIAKQVENLENSIKKDLKVALDKAKPEIMSLLKEEFASRLFLKRGSLKHIFCR